MARARRTDYPGAWHHVVNRGLAKRPAFPHRRDVRFLLSRLARSVRRGEIEVHAITVLASHFHMLVRSVTGEIWNAMQRVTSEYVRCFNQRNDRDGALFRGRYWSSLIESDAYRCNVVRYIDGNPVLAGMVRDPASYPYGSARARLNSQRRPPWIDQSWIEPLVEGSRRSGETFGRAYRRLFLRGFSGDEAFVVERRLGASGRAEDPLASLVGATGPQVEEWFRTRCALADGVAPCLPIASPAEVRTAIKHLRTTTGDLSIRLRRTTRDGWPILETALLVDLSQLTLREAGGLANVHLTTVRQQLAIHRAAILDHPDYRRAAATITADLLDRRVV